MMMRKTIPALMLVLAAVAPQSARGGLQEEMDAMFDSMVNYTAPGVYETQRRGVISGGSFVMRNRIINENLISVVPPSFEAGCGGIDMFGGSFSFINFDRFVQLLRSIASNAAGYAFQLALKTMCPTCMQTIETLQKKLQQLNQLSVSSCELAQGIVTNVFGAEKNKQEKENSLIAKTFGNWGDIFESFWDWGSDPRSPSDAAHTTAPDKTEERIIGNLVWKALTDNNVASWYTYGGTDLLEAMMSITGSIIVREPVDSNDGEGKVNKIDPLPGNLITIKDLIYGGRIKMYKCDEPFRCMKPILNPSYYINFEGFRKKVERLLLGDGSSPGIIYKMAYPLSGGSLSPQEKGFILALPQAYGALLRRLIPLSYQAAVQFAEETIDYIALDMARELLRQMVRATRHAARLGEHAFAKEAFDMIKEAEQRLTEESIELEQKIGKESILAKYQRWRDEIRKTVYFASESENSGGGTL